MVTRIQLGNLVTNNGRTRLIGSESALDTAAIVDSLVEARRLPAVRLEDRNEALTSRVDALNNLRSLLNRFNAAVDVLRNPPGVGNASANIFQYRNATLTANNGAVASNFVSVSAQPGASVQNFNITDIDTIAKEARQETSVFSLADSTSAAAVTATPTAGLFTAGTFTIRNIDSAEPDVSITLNDGDSLQTVASRFNEVSGDTGIRANIIKVADGDPNDDYRIIFTATQTGESYGFDLADIGTVTSDPDGVFANVTVNTNQPAQNARFFIDGIEIIRETNAIDDVFTGLTFTLKQETDVGVNINVGIQPDTEIVTNAIFAFADVYNEFRLFAASQTELGDDGLPTEDAVLANDSTLRSVISRIGSEISGVVNGIAGNNPARLADIGLGFQDFAGDEENPFTRNILTVDADKLAASLSSNFDGVRGLFEFQLQSDNSDLAIFSRTNALGISQFTLNVDQGAGTYQASYIDAQGNPQTIDLDASVLSGGDGVTLRGQAGTVLEGLELIYASADAATIDVTITQGLGDRLFNALEDVLDTDNGFLTIATEQLEEQTARNTREIDRIDEQLEGYRRRLEEQYTALEEALSRANNLLTLLDAQSRALDR